MSIKAGDCACGSGRDYAACCAPLHGGEPAASAETLMRSRYSAYALGLRDYLLCSWHVSTRPSELGLDTATRWLGLSVKQHRSTGPESAEVEFIARYRVGGGSAVRLHERSRFLRENGHWYYLDGEQFG